MTSVSYIPQPVTLSYQNIYGLKSALQSCQISASVNNPLAPNVFTTGK